MMTCLSAAIVTLSVCGVVLSCYAIYIERSKHLNKSYQAYCDLDDTIACSYVLTSEYSIGLGLVKDMLGRNHFLNMPNSYFGVVFFPVMIVLGLSTSKTVLFLSVLFCFFSCLTSAYLIYVLMYVLKKVCLVCMAIHFINFLQLILFTVKWRMGSSSITSDRNVEQTKKVQ